MHGRNESDPKCIQSCKKLAHYIEEVVFLPLFRNAVNGFSVEENVAPSAWWTDDEARDPWIWRMKLAASEEFAYGKFFGGCAGFVSKEWFPGFANIRRNGYDFDARADEGLANKREIDTMRLFENSSPLTAGEIRNKAYLTKALDATLLQLQKQTYIVIAGFVQKVNKRGELYGWHMSIYQTPESKWGYDFVTSAYRENICDSAERIISHVLSHWPSASEKQVRNLVLGS